MATPLGPAQGPPALGGGMLGGSWAGVCGVTPGSARSSLLSIPGLPLEGGEAVSGSCRQHGCSSPAEPPHVSSRRVLSPGFCPMSGFSQPYPFMTPFPRLPPHPGTCASLLGAREKPSDLFEPDREGVSGLGEDVKRLCSGCSCPSYGTPWKMQELLSAPAFDPSQKTFSWRHLWKPPSPQVVGTDHTLCTALTPRKPTLTSFPGIWEA